MAGSFTALLLLAQTCISACLKLAVSDACAHSFLCFGRCNACLELLLLWQEHDNDCVDQIDRVAEVILHDVFL